MPNLLDLVTQRGSEEEMLFTHYYNSLASQLRFSNQVKSVKKNMDKALEVMNLAEESFELQYKYWTTEDNSNADFSEDYPHTLFYKGLKQHVMIKISLTFNELDVNFFYDYRDAELEKWVIEKNHTLRVKFGDFKKATFKVLTKDSHGFETEDVNMDEISIDHNANYNDDFPQIHEDIEKAIQSKKSGIILLHGAPGTGKTTYIKSLISSNSDHNFIFIQNEFVSSLLDPEFISFLLNQRNSILIIEDAEKVISSREQVRDQSIVSTILQLTDGLFSDYLNIKIICTFNTSLFKIDTALMRKGRMIAMYEFKALQVDKTNHLLSSLGAEPSDKELTIADIFNHDKRGYSEQKPQKIGF